jgi:hypothetical protein
MIVITKKRTPRILFGSGISSSMKFRTAGLEDSFHCCADNDGNEGIPDLIMNFRNQD